MIFLSLTLAAAIQQRTAPIQPKLVSPATPPALELPSSIQAIPISADEAARIALQKQPSLQGNLADIRNAHGKTREASSSLYPSLTASSSYSRYETIRPSTEFSSQTPGFTTLATFRQLLFDFNHTKDLAKQAGAQEGALRSVYTKAQNDLVALVKTTYYGWAQNERQIQIQERNVVNRTYQLALAQAKLDAGTGQPADVVQAEANLNDAQQSLVLARASSLDSRIQLAQLIGVDPRTPLTASGDRESMSEVQDLNRLVDSALRQRPEVLSAKFGVAAASSGLNAARSLNMPSLSLGLSTTSRGNTDPQSYTYGAATLTLSFPIFDSGLQGGKLDEARASVKSANAVASSTQLQVISDVSQAFVNLQSATQRKTITSAQVANATEGVRIAQGRYQAGLATFVDVTTAQGLLVTAETNDAAAEASLDQARVALNRAVGAPLAKK